MTTVYEVVTHFCKERGMPPTTIKHNIEIGRMVSNEFKTSWAIKNCKPGLIADTGSIMIKEGEKFIVVTGYPDGFKERMAVIIEWFFNKKLENIKADEERKRLAAKSVEKQPEEKQWKLPRPTKGEQKAAPFRRFSPAEVLKQKK